MKRLLLTHWRTTVVGLIVGISTLLSGEADILSVSWREIATRSAKALAIVSLGIFAKDFERDDGAKHD